MKSPAAAYKLLTGVGLMEPDQAVSAYERAFRTFVDYWVSNPDDTCLKPYHLEIYKAYTRLQRKPDEHLSPEIVRKQMMTVALERDLGI
ncbi:hypothetical protein [Stutzerimonas frequens]|uniref:hypothetical protein n=1 Tax=Stutzerimonas frequens TaxID=2968969 RepID=UPI00190C9296|nr:hypothetical protein [Stutzerimonas frequens]MBK3870459.1 hypothetical protein [Stutzerimonas frequens]MBK3908796.1 hypothetical protein [Stutzerimonas frequens]MBK3929607.1 hypothetical protein [Stutzerimonas frequens]